MGLRGDLQGPQEEKYNMGMLTPFPSAHLPRRGLHLHSSSVFVVTVRRRTEEAPGAGWPKGQGRITVREKSAGPKRGRGGSEVDQAGKHMAPSGPGIARADFSSEAGNTDFYVKFPLSSRYSLLQKIHM